MPIGYWGAGLAFDIAIAVNLEQIHGRKNLRWVNVIVVGPRSNGVTAYVRERYA